LEKMEMEVTRPFVPMDNDGKAVAAHSNGMAEAGPGRSWAVRLKAEALEFVLKETVAGV
jgi:hypothetical protein